MAATFHAARLWPVPALGHTGLLHSAYVKRQIAHFISARLRGALGQEPGSAVLAPGSGITNEILPR